ncbi:MAG: hypothetical protein KC636_29980 [Myxococcales bacterium]|nr:hypothetical protein [Myxococcales bacterium]
MTAERAEERVRALRASAGTSGPRRGRVIGWGDDGRPLVRLDDEDAPQPAELVAPLTEVELDEAIACGLPVIAWLPRGSGAPHIVGVVRPPRRPSLADGDALLERAPRPSTRPLSVEQDGERVVITAPRELLLRCGAATVLLTADGRVRIKGLDITTRATRDNRVLGGKVLLGE